MSYITFGIRAKVFGLKAYAIEEWSNSCKHDSKSTFNNQDAITTCLNEISATQQSHQDAIIQLNSKLDDIMELLENSQEKHSIEDGITSHQFRQSPHRPCDVQRKFMMGNQRRGKIFE